MIRQVAIYSTEKTFDIEKVKTKTLLSISVYLQKRISINRKLTGSKALQ